MRRPGLGRVALTALTGLLLALEVARLTVAADAADRDPALANRLAPFSPATLVSTGMTEIGRAAATASDPTAQTLARFQIIAATAPLRPEPFLVEGAIAQRNGDLGKARALLSEARWRNPRSTAALYLLAGVAFRQNRVVEGLSEFAILARLLPAASVQLIPSRAEFARSPGARETLAAVLKSNPSLKDPLLDALATDPVNADLVLALAGKEIRSPDDQSRIWQSRLLQAFIDKGDYGQAYNLWRVFAGVPEGTPPLLFNGDFTNSSAPPPFNWTYNSGSPGFAEVDHGRLRVIYYGREDFILASQTLLLPPGTYRFDARAGGRAAERALTWSITCDSPSAALMEMPIGAGASAQVIVPPNCRAQTLALTGHLMDAPDTSDLRIGPVTIERIRS
jgi:hypothetical protein